MQTFQNHHKKYFRLHTLARYTGGFFLFCFLMEQSGLRLFSNYSLMQEKNKTHVNCLLKELSRSLQCKANILAHCPEN